MGKTAGRILRGDSVKVEGTFQIGAMQSGVGSPQASVVHSVEPAVSVIETNSEFTIIEVTCSCGTKTSVKCEYAPQPEE